MDCVWAKRSRLQLEESKEAEEEEEETTEEEQRRKGGRCGELRMGVKQR